MSVAKCPFCEVEINELPSETGRAHITRLYQTAIVEISGIRLVEVCCPNCHKVLAILPYYTNEPESNPSSSPERWAGVAKAYANS